MLQQIVFEVAVPWMCRVMNVRSCECTLNQATGLFKGFRLGHLINCGNWNLRRKIESIFGLNWTHNMPFRNTSLLSQSYFITRSYKIAFEIMSSTADTLKIVTYFEMFNIGNHKPRINMIIPSLITRQAISLIPLNFQTPIAFPPLRISWAKKKPWYSHRNYSKRPINTN